MSDDRRSLIRSQEATSLAAGFWNAAEIVQYAARKKNPDLGQPSLFETSSKPYLSDLGPGRWITIHSSEGGGESHGGHRVYIGDDGKMKTGKFAGKSMKEAFGDRGNQAAKPKEKRSTKRGAKHEQGQPGLFETETQPTLPGVGPGNFVSQEELRAMGKEYAKNDEVKKEHLEKGEVKPKIEGEDWETIGNGVTSEEIKQQVPGLAVDPLSIRGTNVLTEDEVFTPKEINNRRVAARARRQKIEREKAGLFADEVAASQKDPTEELKEMDSKLKGRVDQYDNRSREKWIDNLKRLAEKSPEDQAKIVAAWNASELPKDHAYFSGFLTKADSTGLAQKVTNRSDIKDPELKSMVERMDKTWRTLKDIDKSGNPESKFNIASQRLLEERQKYKDLNVSPPSYESDKPSWDEIQKKKQAEKEKKNSELRAEQEKAKKKLLFDVEELKPAVGFDESKPGIIPPTPAENTSAKSGDQLGLFGDVANVKDSESPKLKTKESETKGKQSALFDTKGDKDQMLAFDDGVTPEDRLLEVEDKTPAATFDKKTESGATPREAAEAAQKQADADYEFARASKVSNAGEDLKGSARHKVNEWKGLAEAEKDGTAAELMTRKGLLKVEPHNLMSTISDTHAMSHLVAHSALSAFPESPGIYPSYYAAAKDRLGRPLGPATPPETLRKQYHDAYVAIKKTAEELATTETDPRQVAKGISKEASRQINILRGLPADAGWNGTAKDPYNPVANGLVSLANRAAGGGRKKTDLMNRVLEVAKLSHEKYGDAPSKDHLAMIKNHVLDLMEGKSMNKTFGKESKAVRRFDPSEAYVKHASRKGGRDVSNATSDANRATKHMVESIGLRGVQWGNSVTDDERKHHAAKAVEALTDLADVTGLHPKDIALDGKLGLAIGARGHGNASAHYEPGTQVINLTRSSGVGALAHEWGHAFDHMLQDFKNSSRHGSYMSSSHGHKAEDGKQGIRDAYGKWWSASSEYRARLRDQLRQEVRNGTMSANKANDYWNSDHEIFARTFERHVQHKLESDGRQNTYLAGLGGEHPLWPSRKEAEGMAESFDAILSEYRKHKHGSPEKVKFSAREVIEAFWVSKMGLSSDRLGEPESVRYSSSEDTSPLLLLSDLVPIDLIRYEWNAAAHPRMPAGNERGGEFASKNRMGSPVVAQTVSGAKPAAPAAPRSSRKRQLAEHPPTIKPGHALHHSSLDAATQKRLLDWNSRMYEAARPMDKIPTRKLSEEEQAEVGWGKVNKDQIRSLLAEMNQMDAEYRSRGINLSDFVNANKLIPKAVAERLDGGSRFFDPEKIRAKLHVSNQKQGQDQDSNKLREFAMADRQTRKEMSNDPEFRKLLERALSTNPTGITPQVEKPASEAESKDLPKADASPKSKVPNSLTLSQNRKLDEAVSEAVGDNPEAANYFKSLTLEAWQQQKQIAEEHNYAFNQILGFADKTHTTRTVGKGENQRSITVKKSQSKLLNQIRSGADPSTIQNFDEIVDFAQREFPGAIAYNGGESDTGSAEDGVIRLLQAGMKPVPEPHSDEVIELASDMAGPSFWDAIENPDYAEDQEVAAAVGSEHEEEIPFSVRREVEAALVRYWSTPWLKQTA